MTELIKVEQTNDGKVLVRARELHSGLKVKTRFSLWVTQNFKHYTENQDFTSVVTTTVVNNGALRDLDDYAMTVEMAKHIALMSGTNEGKNYRSYFIEIEKAWNSPEMIMKRALEFADKKILSLTNQIALDKPKTVFADAVSAAKTSILVGELAKLIKQNGINIGANRLFEWLRKEGYLIRRRGTDWNMPTQRSMDLKLFEVKETVISHSDGHTSISKTAKVTGKGQLYFINKFLEELNN